jgi:hypothetical protein
MAKPRLVFIASAAAFAAGCQTVPTERGAPVFQNPDQFVGQAVTVCGYLTGPANILQRPNDVNVGLSIHGGAHARDLAQLVERAPVCLTGTINYIGCETDSEVVCTDWAFDYAINVAEIL